MNDARFAHKLKDTDIEKFHKIMSSEKKFITKRDEEEFEASYFAMCLLLPKKTFLALVDILGGINIVKSDYDKKLSLARVFNVEYRLVEARINDLLSLEKEEEKIKKLKK